MLVAILALAQSRIECNPPGWKAGDPLVLDPGAPCLLDSERRTEMEQRAQSGDGAAAMLLAEFHRFNLQDPSKALEWMRLAAVTNEPDYLYSLASWLAEGEPSDAAIAEARQLAEAGASQGDAPSALLAGNLWLKGVPDFDLAKQAYLQAFRLGKLEALTRLARMAKRAPQTSQNDLIELCSWLKAYLEIGPPNAYMRDRASAELNACMQELTSDERYEVERRVESLKSDWPGS